MPLKFLAVLLAAGAVAAFLLLRERPSHPGLTKHVDVFETNIVGVGAGESLPPTPRLIALARYWAEIYWSNTRCGKITYHYRTLEPRVIAHAQWYSASLSSPTYYDCEVVFSPARIRDGFFLYCAAVVHEFGHLSGFHEDGGSLDGQHSRNPRNIMYPVLTSRNIPATCKKNTDPFRIP